MSARPQLNHDEARVLRELVRLGGEATSKQLIMGVRHVDVRRALRGMERKGHVRKGLDAARNVSWQRVYREQVTHELAFGVVGDRYWGTCSCGFRRWARAGDIAGEDEARERVFQHCARWPRRRWGRQGPIDKTQTPLAPPGAGSTGKP